MSLKRDKNKYKVLSWKHFRPQCEYLIDYSGEVSMDFIGRVESINEDFNYVKEKLGLSSELKNLNEGNHLHYKSYYREETKKL